LYLNVDYKAIVIKIRHAVLKIFEQLYKIFEQLFEILATFEQLFGIFLSNFLPFSEQNLDAPIRETGSPNILDSGNCLSRAPCLGADQKTRGLWERDCSKNSCS